MKSRRFRAAAVLVLAACAVVRLEHSYFAALNTRVRVRAEAGLIMALPGGDVTFRDAPKAQKMAAGHFFADPHYLGEPHWYPFMTPMVAALIARVTRVPVYLAYHAGDMIWRGVSIVGLGVLFVCVLGEWGIVWFVICVLAGAIAPESWCIYPFQSVRGAFWIYFAVASLFAQSLRDWEWPRIRHRAAALGALTGLLGLWHGASFFTAALVSAALAAAFVWRWLFQAPRDWKRLALVAGTMAAPAMVLLSFLLVPQWLHYGHIARAGQARIYLEPFYHGGHSFADFARLSLLPRNWHFIEYVPFLLACLHRPSRPRFWPLVVAAVGTTFMGHLGFTLDDPAHPRFSAWVWNFLPAPPHTFWYVAESLWAPIKWLGYGWLAWLVGSHAWRWSDARRTQLIGGAALLAVATLTVHRWPEPRVESENLPAWWFSFAGSASRTLGTHTVLLRRHWELLWLADFYPLWLPAFDHTNHYVQMERMRVEADLDHAIAARDYAGAERILARYDVGGFMGGDPDAVADSCGGPPVVADTGLTLRLYKGHCGAR